jgi:acylphosphatase
MAAWQALAPEGLIQFTAHGNWGQKRGHSPPDGSQRVSLRTENVTIWNLMATAQIARRYLVSGIVQGVGFRYFIQDEAERLHLSGFVRNLRDGRVEVYAIGSPENLARLRAVIERGPRGAMVQRVLEEAAEISPKFAEEFSITYDQ